MRFRNRMILLYAVFMLVISLAAGGVYYQYNTARFREKEQQSLRYSAGELMQQFDASVNMMRFAVDSLVCDVGVVEAMRHWSSAGRDATYPAQYVSEADATLHARLYTDLFNSFYRVIAFNRYGDVVANRAGGNDTIDARASWENILWLDEVSGLGGRDVLLGLHKDDWGGESGPTVYSLVKELQGNNLGYIEVQYRAEHLKALLRPPEGGVQAYLLDPKGHLLYASEDGRTEEEIREIAGRGAGENLPLAGGMAAVVRSEATVATVITLMPQDAVSAQNDYIIGATVLVSLVILAASLVFVFLISSYLTRPLERVAAMLRGTELGNIGQPVGRMKSIREIESLMDAYRDMTARLARSINAERETSRLHMKAQFDALQAQVNPHFLFNILNVVSRRGMLDGDEEICGICESLAAILRYSTNTKERLATVAEELAYLERYAYLQRSRYQHKFDYGAEADKAVLPVMIPRLTIQQLVENCVRHGYENISQAMRIRVMVTREERACAIRVRDDGLGFPQAEIDRLSARFLEIRRAISEGSGSPGMEPGGMGLTNLYARLYLVYGERVRMSLSNEDGAAVLIRIRDEGQA